MIFKRANQNLQLTEVLVDIQRIYLNPSFVIKGDADVYVLLGSQFSNRPKFAVDKRQIIELPRLPEWTAVHQLEERNNEHMNSLLTSAYLAPYKADILHLSHIFEGFNENIYLPSLTCRSGAQIVSATVYDLIPLVFHHHYFKQERMRAWYSTRINYLKQCDLLLTISDATRQDVIDY